MALLTLLALFQNFALSVLSLLSVPHLKLFICLFVYFYFTRIRTYSRLAYIRAQQIWAQRYKKKCTCANFFAFFVHFDYFGDKNERIYCLIVLFFTAMNAEKRRAKSART